MTTKSVVVTGASFGLAKGTVAVLIREGWQVFGSCVSKGAAEALSARVRQCLRSADFGLTRAPCDRSFASISREGRPCKSRPAIACTVVRCSGFLFGSRRADGPRSLCEAGGSDARDGASSTFWWPGGTQPNFWKLSDLS